MAGIIYEGYMKDDDPRWRDDWSVTVGPGATRGLRPPFANIHPPSEQAPEEEPPEPKPDPASERESG